MATKVWSEVDVRKLSGSDLYRAAVDAGVWVSGMTQEDVIQALINPAEDVPNWALEDESPIENMLRKLMAMLPEPVRKFLEGIEFDEVFLSLIVQVVDNALERRTYVTKKELAEKMAEFTAGINELIVAQKTPGGEDDTAAANNIGRFTLQWWLDPVGSKPAPKK